MRLKLELIDTTCRICHKPLVMGGKKVICFHGTTRADMAQIREDGFKKGTYFAKHLEDALEYGGPWVFEVCFDLDKPPPGCWQFQIDGTMPEADIVALTHYVIAKKFENKDLRTKILESNL